MLLCELMAEYWMQAGIEVHFGLVGEGNFAIATAMKERGIRYIPSRREDGAVNMADGWARRSGKVGFCSVTHGPGLTNALTALTEVTRRHIPFILMTAMTPHDQLDHPQRVPSEDLVRATGAGWVQLRSPATLADDMHDVLRRTAAEARAYVFAVPAEYVYVEVDKLVFDGILPETLPPLDDPRPSVPEPEAIERAVRLIATAKRPLIIAGQGAVRSGAGTALRGLAKQVGAALATTLPANGLFSGDPSNIGVIGTYSTRQALDRIQQSDLVLAFGAALTPYTTGKGELLERATVIQVDTEALSIGRWRSPELALIGDARRTAEVLSAACATALGEPAAQAEPAAAVTTGSASPRGSAPFRSADVVRRLAGVIPRDSVIAVEGSHAASEVVLNLKVSAPERFIMPLHASAIGQGLGCAIGAAVAEPSEWTFLFTGDGSLLMSAQELDTLRQLQLPLVIIVLDDGAYGSEVQYSHLLGLPDALAYTNNPDFVAVANGFGIEARRIEHLDDLDGIRDIVAGPRVPHLVSVPIDPEHLNEWFSSFAGDHHHRLPHWGDGA